MKYIRLKDKLKELHWLKDRPPGKKIKIARVKYCQKNGPEQVCWQNTVGRHPSAYAEHHCPPPHGVRGWQHGAADKSVRHILSQLSLACLGENVPDSEAQRGGKLCLAGL